jgi:hypothetical protein
LPLHWADISVQLYIELLEPLPMISLMLCRGHFSDEFVAQILEQTEGWHVTQTWEPRSATRLSPHILCVISGSKKQQKTGTVKVRFVGGAKAGAFDVKILALKEFLTSIRS